MIEKVAAAKYITTLDLTKGYWQVSLEKATIEKFTFITSRGLYEFLVTFQRMMTDVVLKDFNCADVYIHDVEVETPSTFAQHLHDPLNHLWS